MISAEEKRRQMLNDPVELLVCRLAVPTIITMLISAFYNMADTYFVGQLDTVSTASVGLALPLMNIIQAMGFFFGHGSGNYISGKLGSGDNKSAQVMGDTAAVMCFSAGVLMSIAALLNINRLAGLIGADEILMQSTVEYISVLVIGIPFQMTAFTLNNQLRFRGSAFYGMIGMASGSVLNVILDPIFIYVFGMGVRGAALATVISQITAFIVLLFMSARMNPRKPGIKELNGEMKAAVHKYEIRINGEMVGAIFRYGTPSLCRQGVMSLAAICLNHASVSFGPAVVAAITVVNKIVMVGGSVVIGFGQGFQPVCGFNLGAGRYDRVKRVYLFCVKLSTLFMLAYGAVIFIFAEQLIAFFRDDPQVIAAGIPLLRFQSFTAPLHGIIVVTNMIMQNMGRTIRATVLGIARQGLFFIPLVLILPVNFGLFGLQITQASADLLTAIATAPMAIMLVKELNAKVNDILEV